MIGHGDLDEVILADESRLAHKLLSQESSEVTLDIYRGGHKMGLSYIRKVKEFIGSESPKALEKIILEDTQNNSESEIQVAGAFIAIGHDPATSLFKNKIKMDKDNYIVTKPDSTETSIQGVFAAGDVKDKIYRQAVTAAGLGCMAALEAEKFLAKKT